MINKNILQYASDSINGEMKLPIFQRQYKWKQNQVKLLYDSIRLKYPIGSIILLQKGENVTITDRLFRGADPNKEKKKADFLVLDGQQRITATIDLFFNKHGKSSCYFLNLKKLKEYFEKNNKDFEDEKKIREDFINLDITELDYIKASTWVKDKVAKPLKNNDLFFIPYLHPDEVKARDVYLNEYLEDRPEMKNFISNVLKPFFILSSPETIPVILIDKKFDIEAVTRIFSTLNTTGKMLTAFELVVAILYPFDIDLIESVIKAKEKHIYYKHMDKEGETVLQTIALLNGQTPQKAKLPKTIDQLNWNQFNEQAFENLNMVGKYLTEHLGMNLNSSDKLIPYNVIFPCLAEVFAKTGYDKMSPEKKAEFQKKINMYVIGTALNLYYTQGSQSAIESNGKDLIKWVNDEIKKPNWIKEFKIPSLKKVQPSKTIGKILQCIFNLEKPKDPLNNEQVDSSIVDSELHHIFPRKFVSKLDGWDETKHNCDLILNCMKLTKKTNARFLNDDPKVCFEEIKRKNGSNYLDHLSIQFLDQKCIDLLLKPNKKVKDFDDFISHREKLILEQIHKKFHIPIGDQEIDEDSENEDF